MDGVAFEDLLIELGAVVRDIASIPRDQLPYPERDRVRGLRLVQYMKEAGWEVRAPKS